MLETDGSTASASPMPKYLPAARAFAYRASRLSADAGRHFNRGQRAFFFALGYLGWFLGPIPLALTTTGILIVMWRRQFLSETRRAFAAVDHHHPGQKDARRAFQNCIVNVEKCDFLCHGAPPEIRSFTDRVNLNK